MTYLFFLVFALLFVLMDRVRALELPVTGTGCTQEGIRLANEGQMDESVRWFKRALKLDPLNADYWVNYGVTQMRRRKYKIAKDSFLEALRLNPRLMLADTNLRELKNLASELFYEGELAPIVSPDDWVNTNANLRKSFKKLRHEELYLPENRIYLEGKLPFILFGFENYWNLRNLTFDYLRTHFGNTLADFYPHNIPFAGVHPLMTSLTEALDDFERPSLGKYSRDLQYPGTYIQWNLDSEIWLKFIMKIVKELPPMFSYDDLWLNDCLPSVELRDMYMKRTHWRMMLIGSKGAGMFNHMDVLRTSSWQAQFVGKKIWHICDPSQGFALYGAGKIDVFHPDYQTYPRFAEADCYEGVVEAGEFIYYPMDYWHQTRNLETPSISITSTMVDQDNWRAVIAELRDECSFKRYNWGFSDQLCEQLRVCYRWWENRFLIEGKVIGEKR